MISATVSSLASVWRNAEFTREMTIRELRGVNKGALLGTGWLIISPLIQVGAYVLIVSFVFQRRLDEGATPLDDALYVLSGMIPWQLLQYGMSRAPSLVRDRMEIVKQVNYPIETLPITSIALGAVGGSVSLVIYLVGAAGTGQLAWSLVLLPIPAMILLAFLVGVSWLFMIIGVIVKDLREMVSLVLGLMVFVSPVVASENLVSPRVWQVIQWNPLTHVVICFRDVFWGEVHPISWIIFVVMSAAVFVLGSWVVTRTKLLINEYI